MNSGKKGVRKMREKSQVDDIDRSIYDIRDEEKAHIGIGGVFRSTRTGNVSGL